MWWPKTPTAFLCFLMPWVRNSESASRGSFSLLHGVRGPQAGSLEGGDMDAPRALLITCVVMDAASGLGPQECGPPNAWAWPPGVAPCPSSHHGGRLQGVRAPETARWKPRVLMAQRMPCRVTLRSSYLCPDVGRVEVPQGEGCVVMGEIQKQPHEKGQWNRWLSKRGESFIHSLFRSLVQAAHIPWLPPCRPVVCAPPPTSQLWIAYPLLHGCSHPAGVSSFSVFSPRGGSSSHCCELWPV